MLTHPTHGRLVTLGLTGMAKALDDQQRQPDIATLAFEERLALLVDREATERENKRLVSRLRFASLRQNAIVEDIDMKAPRGLDKHTPQEAKVIIENWRRHYNTIRPYSSLGYRPPAPRPSCPRVRLTIRPSRSARAGAGTAPNPKLTSPTGPLDPGQANRHLSRQPAEAISA